MRKINKPRQAVVLGGGAFSMEPDNGILDKYILNLALVETPRICFLGTASDDGQEYIDKFYDFYRKQKCKPYHLALTDPPSDIESFVLSMDIIHVGGGSTKKIIDTWKKTGTDKIMKKAWEEGVILTGMSAGAICWFEDGIFHNDKDELTRLECTGILEGSFCPHYDDKVEIKRVYRELILDGKIDEGYGVEDGAAIHFIDKKPIRVVSSRYGAKAYKVKRYRKKIVEEPMEAMYLGSDELGRRENEKILENMDRLKIISEFIENINNHDVDAIMKSITKDHMFQDSIGVNIKGSKNLRDAWSSLFSIFPNYEVEAEEIMIEGESVAIYGKVRGTSFLNGELPKDSEWQVPAAWKVVVKDDKIEEWIVYADIEPIREIRREVAKDTGIKLSPETTKKESLKK